MRSKLLLATCAAILGLAAGWLVGHRPAPKNDDAQANAKSAISEVKPNVPVMPSPRKPDLASIQAEQFEIPRSSIYCALWEKEGLRVPRREGDEEFTATWERLRKRLTTVAYRTAFVVQSATIHGAVEDTLAVLDGRRGSGEGFLLSEEWGRKSVWAVVFLGNRPAELGVTFTSATYSANELKVTVQVSQMSVESVGEYVPHLYWIPLPEVRPGLLTMRLYDSETKSDLLVVRTDIVE
jgi:hypothetical protein